MKLALWYTKIAVDDLVKHKHDVGDIFFSWKEFIFINSFHVVKQ